MKSYDERCDAAFKIVSLQGFLTHKEAMEMVVRSGLAEDVAEADELVREGEVREAKGLSPKQRIKVALPKRYDPIMQEAQERLARRHGKLNAITMIDEEEIDNE